jgi:hypothetical protein
VEQTEGACADYQHALRRLGPRQRLRMDHAGERLEQRSFFKRKRGGLEKGVARDHMGRQQQKIGIRPHHHLLHRLRTEIFLSAAAMEARSAGRRRRRHQCVAGPELGHAFARFDHHARKLVAKRRGHTPHRMATAIGLEIGATAQRAFDLEQNFAGARTRQCEVAQPQIAGGEQDGLARTGRGRRNRSGIPFGGGWPHSLRSTAKLARDLSGSAR